MPVLYKLVAPAGRRRLSLLNRRPASGRIAVISRVVGSKKNCLMAVHTSAQTGVLRFNDALGPQSSASPRRRSAMPLVWWVRIVGGRGGVRRACLSPLVSVALGCGRQGEGRLHRVERRRVVTHAEQGAERDGAISPVSQVESRIQSRRAWESCT